MARLNEITNDIIRQVEPKLPDAPEARELGSTQDAEGGVVGEIADILSRVKTMWQSVFTQSREQRDSITFIQQIRRVYSRAFAIDAYADPAIETVLKAAVKVNVQLIRSIEEQHLNAVSELVLRNVQAGYYPKEIISSVQSYGVTKRRARLIARDQTAKTMGLISKAKQASAGFEYFRWQTSEDERVRPSHTHAQNAITKYGRGVYRWDDLPVVDGEKTFPTQPIQCRCVAIPVCDFEVEKV